MLFGLLGEKLGHSFSKAYFMEKFHAEGIDAVYENFEMADRSKELPRLIEAHPNLRGLNVTIPYKQAVIPILTRLSPTAKAVGAVNTIQFSAGEWIGHNTDVIGFRDSLAEVYEFRPGGTALILGTGGSAKAVRHVLEHYFEFDAVRNVSREPQGDALGYAALPDLDWNEVRLIVNCTPVGMYPKVGNAAPLPWDRLNSGVFVFDLIYNPVETELLTRARQQGCPTRNGMDMLIRQAEAAWAIWMG
ncbi:MAG: shikimate dehydrogenase [Bacteroidia bacterium]